MFGGNNLYSMVVGISEDPAADQTYPMWRVPQAIEVKAAYATVVDDVAASTTDHFNVSILNGGTLGTATSAVTNTVGGTLGWTGLTPKTFSITGTADIAAGEVLVFKYDESGTGTFGQVAVQIDYVLGT